MSKTGNFEANGSQVASAGNANVLNTLYVWGNFGGGNIKIDCTPDGSEYFDIIDPDTNVELVISAKKAIAFRVKSRSFRLTLAGATAPDVKWAIL